MNGNYHPFDYTVRADRGYWSTRPKDSDFHRDPPQPSDRWKKEDADGYLNIAELPPPLEVQSRMTYPDNGYPIIALAGDPESGKSTVAKFLSMLVPGFRIADTSEMLRRILVEQTPILQVEYSDRRTGACGCGCDDEEGDNMDITRMTYTATGMKSAKSEYDGRVEGREVRENLRALMANTIRAIGYTLGYDKFFQACVKAAGVNLMPKPGVPLVIDSVRKAEQWQAVKQLYPTAKLWFVVKPTSPQHLRETQHTWPGNAADWLLINDADLATLKERILKGLDFGAAKQPTEWDLAGIVNQFYGRLEAVSKESK